MSENALAVKGLTKKYPDFILDEVSFCVPRGTIVGIIGENGAGKSTIIKAVLNLIEKDSGNIELLGREELSIGKPGIDKSRIGKSRIDKSSIDFFDRNRVGVVFDGNNFPDTLSPGKLGKLLKTVYAAWDENLYSALLERFSVPADKKIRKLSKGMKMKLSIAAALSHSPEFLILDEATSGLDPIVRDDILDILLEFVQKESHAVLMSSHITSDLEKIADYIVFLRDGRVVFEKPKDELRYKYGIIKCGAAQFEAIDKSEVIAWRKLDYEWQVLIADRKAAQAKYPDAVIDPATIDDIMLLFVKGEVG